MAPRMYLFLTFFMLYSATLYISGTALDRLKLHPFHWRDINIRIINTISIFIQFFAVFLGGFVAAFIIPVSVLLIVSFSSLLVSLSVFEVTFLLGTNHTLNITKSFFEENYVGSIVVSVLLFGIYSGLTKFLLLVMMCEQDEPTSIEYTSNCYLFTVNVCISFVYIAMPSSMVLGKYNIIAVLPLIVISMVMLVIGRWKNVYCLNSMQINIVRIIHVWIWKRDVVHNYAATEAGTSDDLSSLFPNSSGLNVGNKEDGSTEALLSFSKLCIIFVTLLPYAVCESQVRTTFMIQSQYLEEPDIHYYAMKNGYWVQTINCGGVILFIPLLAVLRHVSHWFKRIYSKRMYRIMASNICIILSIMSAAILETIRLKIFQETWRPSNLTNNHLMDNKPLRMSNISIFYMAPQLLFTSISEILMVTTCVEFLYQGSVSSMKYLAIAFVMGAIGSCGAGDLINFAMSFILNYNLFDPTDLNKRTCKNGTHFESRFDYWFYGLMGLMFLSTIFTTIMLTRFKHYYETEPENNDGESNNAFNDE